MDIGAYLTSLRALAKLSPAVLCAGHYSSFTGRHAVDHIRGSIHATEEYQKLAETYLREENYDVERTVERIRSYEWEPRLWPKQPESAYILNTRQRVRTVLTHVERTVRGKAIAAKSINPTPSAPDI